MMKIIHCLLVISLLTWPHAKASPLHSESRLKEIGRFASNFDNELIGYGIVAGLAGTGDSSRSQVSIQSIANTLTSFGVTIKSEDIQAKNIAAVMVTASLPPLFEKGDRIDIKVASIGDARSLAGGVLFMTPLKAANDQVYVLGQGQISVGGYAFSSFDSRIQKNHPTVGIVSNGGLVAKSAEYSLAEKDHLSFVLDEPDLDNVQQIVEAVNKQLPEISVTPIHAAKLEFGFPSNTDLFQRISWLNAIEKIAIRPDIRARVVINERTGTIVAGGDVKISKITVSHGSLKLEIDTQYRVSQPMTIGRAPDSISTEVVPDTRIQTTEATAAAVQLDGGATVSELVEKLRVLNTTTRDIIVILQLIKRAGALHAELLVE